MGLTIEIKKNDPKTILLLWEGEPWREVYKSLFFSELRKFPAVLAWEEFNHRFSLLEEKLAKKQAVQLLAKRAYLSADLESKLLLRGISPKAAKLAIFFCQEKGYLNDEVEIARLIDKEQRKGRGTKAIFFKLKQTKKLDEHKLHASLNKAALLEPQVLEKWLEKNRRKIPHDREGRKKWIAKLIRRGFSAELVFKAFES